MWCSINYFFQYHQLLVHFFFQFLVFFSEIMSSKELKSIKSCIWLSEGWWLHTMDIIHGQYGEVTACYINLRCNLKVWQWLRLCASLVFSPQLVEELDFLWYLIWHIQNKLHLWKTFVLLNATVCFFVGVEETGTYIFFFFYSMDSAMIRTHELQMAITRTVRIWIC